jgi:hypothetical protein
MIALKGYINGENYTGSIYQECEIGTQNKKELLEPFVAFVHHKEFQIA